VRLINRAKALLEKHKIRAYSAGHDQGWIRHLLVRTSTLPHPNSLPRGEGGASPGEAERRNYVCGKN
jgi:hypothetical protein